jgi:replicative superfamily II helicase
MHYSQKWDSVTRRWTDNFFLFGSVKLLLLDEIHLLADSSRGCCLESVVCRMKSIQLAARQIQTTQADIEGSK